MLAVDVATLEELKEMSSRRKAIEESIGQNRNVTDAIAREMSGGLTSRCQQVQDTIYVLPTCVQIGYFLDVTRWVNFNKIKFSLFGLME